MCVRAVYFGALGFEASGKVRTFTFTCMRTSSIYVYIYIYSPTTHTHTHGHLCFHAYIVFSLGINSIGKSSRKRRMYKYQL